MEKISMKDYLSKEDKSYHVVKIATPWCGYCKMMAGVVEDELQAANDETFYYIDADKSELWEAANQGEFKIDVVPTYFLVKDGKILGKKQAFVPLDVFNNWISENK